MDSLDDAELAKAIAKKKEELDALQKRLQMKAELERLTKACETTQAQLDSAAAATAAAAPPHSSSSGRGGGGGSGSSGGGGGMPPAKKLRTAGGGAAAMAGSSSGSGGNSGPGWYSLNAKGASNNAVVIRSLH